MAIPDYQTIMLPLLGLLGDKQEHSLREAIDSLAENFKLTDEERKKLLSSGQQPIFNNRVGWARTYMKKAGLLESTRRGFFRITDRGLDTLSRNLPGIDSVYLEQFQEFKEFKSLRRPKVEDETVVETTETPEEILSEAYLTLRDTLAKDILQQIKKSPPSLFEKIVIDLLVKMGYGGSVSDAGKAIGGVGDEGIDGVIKEDRLGLDTIYVQAKRWESTVGRPEIQKFAGALAGQHAKKGIFITTSDFSKDARDYADRIENKIILIDGEQLAQYMIDYNIGASPQTIYEIKKVDIDYFTEE